MKAVAIDLFCGIGGLSYGLKKAGISVVAGVDFDSTCKFAFEENVKADFISKDIAKIQAAELKKRYQSSGGTHRILVGCAPCQPFSAHSNKNKNKKRSSRWRLLNEFSRLIKDTQTDIVSMENVPNLSNQKIFEDFVELLKSLKYYVIYQNVYCPDYGIPQKRRRLVLLASRLGEIDIIPPTHKPSEFVTVKDAIGHLPIITHGKVCQSDTLHRTTRLTGINLRRIQASKPNGTWLDWDKELRLKCHMKESGSTYKSVYGRMSWDEPSPTITTQFYNYGTGRFGHPTQDRPLTVREGALLQTFPPDYRFLGTEEEFSIRRLGIHIGNAVPVELGYVIGKSIKLHLKRICK